MRIAQVAPLYESVPPKYYGGTERIVSYLTEELVRQGHDVTLFASGDSVTRARLIAACVWRISPEKRGDRAIEIAKRVNMPLKIAAKMDWVDKDYFDGVVQPLLRDSRVEFVGEIGDGEKEEFLGNAYAVLFTIDWPDPFGLVMIETMAFGTPVIVYKSGSVPEVREQGRTGFIVKELDDVVQAVQRVSELSRKRCREVFDQRFTASPMASDYVRFYERIIWRKSKSTLAA